MPSPKSKPRPRPPRRPRKPRATFRFEAIGTAWSIDIYEPIVDTDAAALLTVVTDRIEAFDKHYSRFRPDSLISEMAQRPGTYKLPADAKPLLDLYAHMYGLTEGAMTPLIGQLLTDAGYKSFCIDAGGDIVQRDANSRPLRVGLEHPGVTGHVIGVATITNQSLCGSAGNRRAWGAFNHIMDPHSRTSPKHIKALWVIADTALLADALATCLFFVSPAKLARYTFEYAIIYQDYSLGRSPGFPATFFTETRRS